jgi:hypothetical protein
MFVVGGTCFAGAAIVLLHRWLQEWWIAFALAGGVLLVVGIGLWLALGLHGQKTLSKPAANSRSRTPYGCQNGVTKTAMVSGGE